MKRYDLYAIGNALVDSEYEVSDVQLAAMGVAKRHMTLIDAPRRDALLAQVQGGHARRSGGGSAANTVVALAQLGGRGFYSCRVADDDLGRLYAADLAGNGVDSNLAGGGLVDPRTGQTGSCLVLVTPDAERSMNTFLGTTADLDDSALDAQALAASGVYYMEGYLAASPSGLAAALKGRTIAQQAGVALATTLSDMSMINFCRPGLEAMLADGLDYLFANEEEAQTWCASKDMPTICAQLARLATTVCLTRSAKGCLVLTGGQQFEVPAAKVNAVDTNGAGDMFAGAFLYARTQGHGHAPAAWLANQAAGQVVSHYGNRLDAQVVADVKAAYARHLAG